MKMKTNHNMTRKQSNKITAIIFAASAFLAAVLIGVGMTMSPAPAHAKTSSDYDTMDLIASAQGTKIEQISPEIPKTIEEKALADEMNNLATANERAKAEKLINSQISYAREKAEAAKAQKEAEAVAAKAAADKAAADAQAKATLDTTRQHYATVSGSSGHTDISEQTNGAPSSTTPVQAANTINILGETIPFIDAYDVTRAPEHGCGVWRGDDLVDDGGYCYFVGHNPGDFHNVMKLQNGNPVTVADSNGHIKTYIVHDNFIVAQKSNYQDIASRVEGHGESIVMQTCCGDGVNVRVVVAW